MSYQEKYNNPKYDLWTLTPPIKGSILEVILGNGKCEKWKVTAVHEEMEDGQKVWYFEHEVIT